MFIVDFTLFCGYCLFLEFGLLPSFICFGLGLYVDVLIVYWCLDLNCRFDFILGYGGFGC